MIYAIVGHLLGDFVFQNDWIAKEKKRSSEVCFFHALVWTFCVVCCAGWQDHHWAIATLLITHFIQDRFNLIPWYMDAVGQREFRTGPCSPWSVIVVDQVWHIVTIYAIDVLIQRGL